ncbi:MAG: sigma-70 family RNA polymerase sigma factor [Planctomycetales bacterium]|nr:sigma-70 family RNA polymerase sigma factor [Planctomycetales bacterium]
MLTDHITKARFSLERQWELISQVQRTNDSDAWSELLQQFAPMIRRCAKYAARTIHDAESRESVVLLRFIDAIRKIDPGKCNSPMTYVYRALTRPINNTEHSGSIRVPDQGWRYAHGAYRRAVGMSDAGTYGEHQDAELDAIDDESDPSDSMIREERIQFIRSAINQLPRRLREIIHCRMEGMTLDQTATACGIRTRQRCHQLIQRAHNELRETLSDVA